MVSFMRGIAPWALILALGTPMTWAACVTTGTLYDCGDQSPALTAIPAADTYPAGMLRL